MEGINSDQILTVLLVEDNPDHAVIIKRAFLAAYQKAHIEILNNGQDALNYIQQQSSALQPGIPVGRPDLILLDIKLPKMDGYQLAKMLKKSPEYNSIPIIILTTSARAEDRTRMLECGVDGFITKPGHIRDFVKMTNEIKRLLIGIKQEQLL